MKVMLLVAHGSRNSNANQEIERLAGKVGQIAAQEYAAVIPAFLEFAQPDIVRGIDQCVERGASSVTVVPYFLTAGNHVTRDVPAQLDSAREKYPELEISQASYVGALDAMAGLVAQTAI